MMAEGGVHEAYPPPDSYYAPPREDRGSPTEVAYPPEQGDKIVIYALHKCSATLPNADLLLKVFILDFV